MAIQLGDMGPGTLGRVLGFGAGSTTYRRKLLSMGLTPGVRFSVVRRAPMGDPIEIRVRGFSLTLRRAEASALVVEVCAE